MAKTRFYLQAEQIKQQIKVINKDFIHKIKNVLRLKKEDIIYIFDGKGSQWEYEIKEIKPKTILLTKIKKNIKKKPPKTSLVLGIPLIQEKKIDFILQKATELGVTGFIPFLSSRTKSKGSLQSAVTSSKIKRWQKIIIEACRQSERLWIPTINNPLNLNELTEKYFNLKLIALPHENDKITTLKNKPKNILCVVGPEGGFSSKELDDFKKHHFNPISLSENILRTETAAIFISGLIKYLIQ